MHLGRLLFLAFLAVLAPAARAECSAGYWSCVYCPSVYGGYFPCMYRWESPRLTLALPKLHVIIDRGTPTLVVDANDPLNKCQFASASFWNDTDLANVIVDYVNTDGFDMPTMVGINVTFTDGCLNH